MRPAAVFTAGFSAVVALGACRPKPPPPQVDAGAPAASSDAGLPPPGVLVLESSTANGVATCVVRDRDTRIVYGHATAARLDSGATCADFFSEGKVIRFASDSHFIAKDARLGPSNDRRLPCDDTTTFAPDASSCVVRNQICDTMTGQCSTFVTLPITAVKGRTWDVRYCAPDRLLVATASDLELKQAPTGKPLAFLHSPRQTTIHHCENGIADTSNNNGDPHSWKIERATIFEYGRTESWRYQVGSLQGPDGYLECVVTKDNEIVGKATSKNTAPDVKCDQVVADGNVLLFRRNDGGRPMDYFAKDGRLGASNDTLLPCGDGVYGLDMKSCIKRGKDAIAVCEIPSGACHDLRPIPAPVDDRGPRKTWDARYISTDLALLVGNDQITLHEVPSGKLVSSAAAPRRFLFSGSKDKDGVVDVIGAKPNGSLFFRVDRDAITPVPVPGSGR